MEEKKLIIGATVAFTILLLSGGWAYLAGIRRKIKKLAAVVKQEERKFLQTISDKVNWEEIRQKDKCYVLLQYQAHFVDGKFQTLQYTKRQRPEKIFRLEDRAKAKFDPLDPGRAILSLHDIASSLTVKGRQEFTICLSLEIDNGDINLDGLHCWHGSLEWLLRSDQLRDNLRNAV